MEPMLCTSTHWPTAPDRSAAVIISYQVRTYSRSKIGRRLVAIMRQAATACSNVNAWMKYLLCTYPNAYKGSKQAPCDMLSWTCLHSVLSCGATQSRFVSYKPQKPSIFTRF